MQFIAEQIIPEGYTLRYIVMCGPSESQETIAVEGLYIKRTGDSEFKIAISTVLQHANEGRFEELRKIRTKLLEPFEIDGEGVIMLPFITILKLRAEAWIKAEPFLQQL